jgi:phosphoglycerate dehydrogenase-like enzyme
MGPTKFMKVIVADKISDRGIQLLKEQPGWKVVLTTKDNLVAELADADALVVRSATKVTPELLDKAPRLRAVGRAGVGVDNIDLEEARRSGDEHAGRKFRQCGGAYIRVTAGPGSPAAKIRCGHARRPLGKIFFWR